jgi:hypothetical protein
MGRRIYGQNACSPPRSCITFHSMARASAMIALRFSLIEGDDERWSAQFHAPPRLERLGSRSHAKYV